MLFSPVLLLLAGLAGLSPHPISNYQMRLELTPDATLLTINFTYDDVVMVEGVSSDEEGIFSAGDLRSALAAYQRRVVEGTRLYDAEGEVLVPESVTLTGTTDPSALDFQAVTEVGGTLHFRYPSLPSPRECSILMDWGGWRLSISTSYFCRWSTPEGSEGRVLWRERQRYPLLPGDDEEMILFDDQEVTVARPLSETLSGFCYLYVEADHVRHELILPLISLDWVLATGDSELPTVTRVGLAERALMSEELGRRFSDGRHLVIGDAPVEPAESFVRWFTRDSLRRGIAADDEPIPLATGYVGLLAVHPTTEPARRLVLDTTGWSDLVNDQVVSVIAGEKTDRFLANFQDPRVEWEGDAKVSAMPVPTDVEHETPRRFVPLAWMALFALILAAPLFARRKRGAGFGLVAIAAGLGIVFLFGPRRGLDEDRGRAVLEALVDNLYRASGRRDERQALELLATTSEGELLEELFLELRGQLRGPWATGAGTVIEDVHLTECELSRSDARRIEGRCTWLANVRIEHWGHVHDRSLSVTAQLTARAAEETWRLADVVLLDKQVAAAESRPRR